MGARLHVLGAGSILPRRGFGCAGYALETGEGEAVTLLDCGPGSVRNLAGAGIALARVRAVVLSHFHLDHWLDLYALFFARRNPSLAPAPQLEVVGPAGLKERVDGAPGLLGSYAADPDLVATEVEPEPGAARHLGNLVLRCTPTGHTPEALAWRVELPGGAALAYTGDTGPNPAVSALARGVDLLVAECSFPDGEGPANHLTPTGAGRMAADAGCSRLLLTHFYPGVDPERARETAGESFGGPIEIARDGSVHALDRDPTMGA